MSKRRSKQRKPTKPQPPASRVIVRKRSRHPDPLRKPPTETHALDWDPRFDDFDRQE
jgi:hypothetical protein